MKPAMYIFVNKGLGMTPGKCMSQSSHAAVEAFRISQPRLIEAWDLGKHYAKYVMVAEDELHLHTIKHYIEERGFKTVLIIDEGHTEIRPHTVTALGVEIVDKDDPHTAATFSDFKTYRETPARPKPDKLKKRRWYHS